MLLVTLKQLVLTCRAQYPLIVSVYAKSLGIINRSLAALFAYALATDCQPRRFCSWTSVIDLKLRACLPVLSLLQAGQVNCFAPALQTCFALWVTV